MFKNKDNQVFRTFLVYFVVMLCFTTVRVISNYNFFSNIDSEILSMIFSIIIQVGIMFVIPFSLYSYLNRNILPKTKTISNIGFRKVNYKIILISIALGVMAFLANIIISTIFGTTISMFGYKNPSVGGSEASMFSGVGALMIDIAFIAILPAVFEELLHRGLLLHNIQKLGAKKAILISSILFGLIHFNINQVSYAIIIGLLLGVITIVSKSIIPAIIIHFVNNGLSVYISHAATNGWVGKNFYSVFSALLGSSNLIVFVFNITLFSMFLIWLFYALIVKVFKITTIDSVNIALSKTVNTNTAPQISDMEKHILIHQVLSEKSNINLDVKNAKSPLDIILPINRNPYKMTLLDKSFLTGSIVLGSIATISTLVWGFLWLI